MSHSEVLLTNGEKLVLERVATSEQNQKSYVSETRGKKRSENENEKSASSGQCSIFLSVCQCTEVRLGQAGH